VKVLAIGHEFHDERIASVNFRHPVTALEYDAVIWWPGSVRTAYEAAGMFQGRPSLPDSASFQLRDDASRRLGEFRQLLKLGRTLILVVPRPESWNMDTGKREYSGTGRNRQVTRIVETMELERLLPVDLGLTAAQGTEIAPVGSGPTTDFWRSQRKILYYDAYMSTPVGEPTMVIRGTDHVVGSIGRVDGGLVVCLPQPNLSEPEWRWEDEDGNDADEERLTVDPDEELFVGALLELLGQLRSSGEKLPAWTSDYALEREADQFAALQAAGKRVARAQDKVAELEADLARLRERKALFSGSGLGLEVAVEHALRALGFDVEHGAVGRTDRVIIWKGREAVVEIKGVEKSAAEKHAAQLQKWVSERHAETGNEPKGILVVNAWRNTPLADRGKPAFPDQMLGYAERQRHCLVTGLQLLCAWADAEANPARRDELAASLLDTSGRWERYEAWQSVVTPLVADTPQSSASDRA
jgi:hypothetical protein